METYRGLAQKPCWAVMLEGLTGLASSSLDGKKTLEKHFYGCHYRKRSERHLKGFLSVFGE